MPSSKAAKRRRLLLLAAVCPCVQLVRGAVPMATPIPDGDVLQDIKTLVGRTKLRPVETKDASAPMLEAVALKTVDRQSFLEEVVVGTELRETVTVDRGAPIIEEGLTVHTIDRGELLSEIEEGSCLAPTTTVLKGDALVGSLDLDGTDKVMPLDMSIEASRMLLEADARGSSQHNFFFPYFSKQKEATTCGIQSACIVLNVLRSQGILRGAYHNQFEPFSEAGMIRELGSPRGCDVIDVAKMRKVGISLSQLEKMCVRYGAVGTSKHYASKSSLDEFRNMAVVALGTNNRRSLGRMSCVVVNYDMKMLGQMYAGHISPIAAYHAPSDSVLLLDVWPHTHVGWVSVSDLFAAMDTLDPESSKSRGYLVVQGEEEPDSDGEMI